MFDKIDSCLNNSTCDLGYYFVLEVLITVYHISETNDQL